MTKTTLITEKKELDALVARLSRKSRIACDTEAASFHRYRDRVFLIQFSSDAETAIVDPLAHDDLSGVGKILKDPHIEVVFHDADFDLRSLHRDYEWEVNNVFDTRVAAQLLGEPAIGLGALLEKYFDVKVDKRFQRADWSKRPLDQEMIDYAAGDTFHLLGLRDQLEKRLSDLGRLTWAQEEFATLTRVRWGAKENETPKFLKIKGIRGFDPASLGVLKAVYQWRENEAEKRDVPPFRVISNQALVDIAKASAKTTEELLKAGVPKNSVKRYGEPLAAAARTGSEEPYLEPKRTRSRTRLPAAGEGVVDALKQLRNETSEKLGIEPGVLCPNGTLQAIARATPGTEDQLNDIGELRSWQTSALGGEKIIELVNK